jgi:RecA-family ATPase
MNFAERVRGPDLGGIDFDAIKRQHPLRAEVEKSVRLKPVGGKGEWSGLCPFHSENTPSFTVYADDSRWYCHGCRRGGDVVDFVAERDGVTLADAVSILSGVIPIRPKSVAALPATAHAVFLRPGQSIVASFDFYDEHGELIYRKHRIEPGDGDKRKSFRFDRPDDAGGWVAGQGEQRVPYRLPDVLAAPPSAPIYLVEGEAKADKLAGWGLLASSLKDWRADFARHVAGRRVVVLPDNDEAGEKQARDAIAMLEQAGCQVLLLDLPGLPPKGDILDWQGTARDLRELVRHAFNTNLLPVLDPGDWQGKAPPPRLWALADWIPQRQMTYLTGAGSAGKSLLGQQLATCIGLGLPFLGLETRAGAALYLSCEDDGDELHRRQDAICLSLGVEPLALSGKLFLASLTGALGNELAVFDDKGRLAPTDAWRTLQRTVQALGIRFVVLDNTAHLFAGNENARNEVAAFANLLNGLAAEIDGAVLLLGHPNKAGDDYSGSTAWSNQVRSRLFLERPKESDGSIPDCDARALVRAKANYAKHGEALSFRWSEWAFVIDDDGKGGDAGYRETVQASGDNLLFLACLRERNRQKRAVSEKSSLSYAPKVFAGMPESKRIGKARLEKAMDRLFRIGKIERGELWKGSDRKPVCGLREIP